MRHGRRCRCDSRHRRGRVPLTCATVFLNKLGTCVGVAVVLVDATVVVCCCCCCCYRSMRGLLRCGYLQCCYLRSWQWQRARQRSGRWRRISSGCYCCSWHELVVGQHKKGLCSRWCHHRRRSSFLRWRLQLRSRGCCGQAGICALALLLLPHAPFDGVFQRVAQHGRPPGRRAVRSDLVYGERAPRAYLRESPLAASV